MNTKKLRALLLAIVVVAGIFAMTASAYYCPTHGTVTGNSPAYTMWTTSGQSHVTNGCAYKSGMHAHYYASRVITIRCNKCSNIVFTRTVESSDYCPYGDVG